MLEGECILTSVEGKALIQSRIQVVKELDVKLRPMDTVYCVFHHNNHLVDFSGEDVVDARYGRAPVEVIVSDKPDTYVSRRYCHVCYAYHTAEQSCGGRRMPTEWNDKEINL